MKTSFRIGLRGAAAIVLLACLAWPATADEPFRQHRYDLLRQLPADSNDILFVGNSITDMFNWDEAFYALPEPYRICNRGVSGALSDDVLANIDWMAAGHPRQMFLMIGTNDLGQGHTPQQVADNVARIVERVKKLSPHTQLFIQSVLPSTAYGRTLESEQAANALLRQVADTAGVTYIDLWEAFLGIVDDPHISLDGLHLTAAGYRIWCERLAPYLDGKVCEQFGSADPDSLYTPDLAKAHAMRAGYFHWLPSRSRDMLFFGDEMVKCGEWQELTGNADLMNRGSGWGYDGKGPSIAITRAIADNALKDRSKPAPRAILLYTGTGDVNSDTDLAEVQSSYDFLLHDIHRLCPQTPIYLVSLMPEKEPSQRITQFNEHLRQLAEGDGGLGSLAGLPQLHYIDIYSSLTLDSMAAPRYFQGNYLNGEGYKVVAQLLNEALEKPYDNDYRTLMEIQQHRSKWRNSFWVNVSNSFALSPLPAIGHLTYAKASDNAAATTWYNGCELASSWLLTTAVTMGVKDIVKRPRPWKRYAGELECLQQVPSYSFPSGHTALSFATATSLSLVYPKWYVAVPAFLWAGAVGYSRMYVGAHYPSDVVTGAVIGVGCAVASHLVRLRIAQSYPEWAPTAAIVVPITITL